MNENRIPDQGVQVYRHSYKGWASVVIESEAVRAEVVPELGGKIVSLLYKPTGKQWLLDAGSRVLRQPDYGSAFTDWDMSGWDECFPTINACSFAGTELPDHGEVWPLPWNCEVKEGTIACAVDTVRLPLRLTRTLSMPSPDTLRLAYRADNLHGESETPFLWAAHPQFAVDEPTRVLLPESMREMLCVFGGRELTAGTKYPVDAIRELWPDVTGDGRKFYYAGALDADSGWSGLYGRDSRSYLLLRTSPADVPHLGVWIDEGMFNDRSVCALEPGIGYYDSLERAAANGTAGLLAPGGCREWQLDIVLGDKR